MKHCLQEHWCESGHLTINDGPKFKPAFKFKKNVPSLICGNSYETENAFFTPTFYETKTKFSIEFKCRKKRLLVN